MTGKNVRDKIVTRYFPVILMTYIALKNKRKITCILNKFGQYTLLGIAFFLPISTSITNILFYLTALLVLLTYKWSYIKNIITRNHVALTLIGFWLLFSIGTIYSQVNFINALMTWKKHIKFILAPLFCCLFIADNKLLVKALKLFIISMLLTCFLGYLKFFGIISVNEVMEPTAIFKSHIQTGILLAYVSFVLLVLAKYNNLTINSLNIKLTNTGPIVLDADSSISADKKMVTGNIFSQSVHKRSKLQAVPQTIISKLGGMLSLYADGFYRYTPPFNIKEDIDSFDYTIINPNNSKYTLLYILLFMFTMFNNLFLSTGRTGYVINFILILLFLFRCLSFRWTAIFSVILLLMSIILYNTSNSFSTRVIQTQKAIEEFRDSETSAYSSVGLRISFFLNGIKIIQDNPFYGSGVGSVEHRYKQIEKNPSYLTDNPHNEYINVGIQIGIIGILYLLYMFAFHWFKAIKTVTPYNILAEGLVITIAFGSIGNSLLMDTTEGHFYVYFIVAYLGTFVAHYMKIAGHVKNKIH